MLDLTEIYVNMASMKATQTQIADKVRGVAAENRVTQQRMADTLAMSRASVVERINGRVPFTGVELLTLAQAMNVPVTRFFPEVSDRSAA